MELGRTLNQSLARGPEAETPLGRKNSIALPEPGMDIGFALRQFTYQARINEILEGRRLNGEPEDFNF